MRSGSWLLFVAACSSREAPPAPRVAEVPAAAAELAKTFATDVAGTIEPIAVTADHYGMSLALEFTTFITTELKITEHRLGTWWLTLADDNTATACAGSRSMHASQGQYHYERDPAKRQHSSSEDVLLAALSGTWRNVDGVAVIRLDHIGWGSCDLAKVVTTGQAYVELRCIGIKAPALATGKRIACELGAKSQTFGLGVPMTAASRTARPGPARGAPEGRQIVFGAPGVKIVVAQDAQDAAPRLTFSGEQTVLDSAQFQKQP
jgi:hypothetical protein